MADEHDYSTWDIVKATQYGIFDRCKEIVEGEGFDVRKPDDQNITVLHWAAINNRKGKNSRCLRNQLFVAYYNFKHDMV